MGPTQLLIVGPHIMLVEFACPTSRHGFPLFINQNLDWFYETPKLGFRRAEPRVIFSYENCTSTTAFQSLFANIHLPGLDFVGAATCSSFLLPRAHTK
jgi:hypothetical protein